MPSLDPARLRVRLAAADLPVLHGLLTGAEPAAEPGGRLEALRAAGLVHGDDVHPLVAAVVRAVTGAQVLIDVEVSGPAGVSGQGVAVAGDVACVLQAWPDDEEGEYALATPDLAVPALALAAGLAPAPAGSDRLVALLQDLRRCVRFTSSGPDRAARGVVLLDAGALGYWTRTLPAEPLTADALTDPDLRVRLEPVTPSQVWAALVGLL